MVEGADTPSLKVLHVLTLNGRNGEYGGPVRVARELCAELNRRGHETHIFSGALRGSEPIAQEGLNESYLIVNPLSKRFKVSSLWSWKIVRELKEKIKNADIVHIHFARDLIPFTAALLSILMRKPFVTQTHGMIISDSRRGTRLTDLILTKPLMNRSKINLVLTQKELDAIEKMSLQAPSFVLPNGIKVPEPQIVNSRKGNRVVFCSRLNQRKRVHLFINLAEEYRDSGLNFEIYGPDGGDLEKTLREIENRKLSEYVLYKGSLSSELVPLMLSSADLLVLPSENEPFPMVVLESLAVGTPVLVMPSCGISAELRDFNDHFVASCDEFQDLHAEFEKIWKSDFLSDDSEELVNFCREIFGIETVVASLEKAYLKGLDHD